MLIYLTFNVITTLGLYLSQVLRHRIFVVFVFLYFTIIVGFRHQVGGDWFSYLDFYNYFSYNDVPISSDIGYYYAGRFLANLGFEIYLLNFICSIIFFVGMYLYFSTFSHLSLLLAWNIPFTIMILAMGYTRQATALGFVMIAIAIMKRSRFLSVSMIIIASLFHKSAIIFLLLLFSGYVYAFTFLLIAIFGYLYYAPIILVLENYIFAQKQSEGYWFRLIANFPLILFLFNAKYINQVFPVELQEFARRARLMMLLLLLFSLVSTTFADRFLIYFFVLLSPVLLKFIDFGLNRQLIYFTFIGYSFSYQFIWLTFANTADSWVPYTFLPL